MELSQLELGIMAEVAPHRISLSERALIILEKEEKERLSIVLKKDVGWLFKEEPKVLPFGGMPKKVTSH